jgi:kynurenine formamidase
VEEEDKEACRLLAKVAATARSYDLEHPRAAGMPDHPDNTPAFYYGLDRRHEPGPSPRTTASGALIMSDHSGTHIGANVGMCGNRAEP